ncbi:putative 3-hydroxybutyryl-CoA dehydrogenase [Candidatus Hepatincola sp. Av]
MKDIKELKNIAVLGSGVLGGQIAYQSAFKGKQVIVYDISQEALARCKIVHDSYGKIYKKDLNATDEDVKATTNHLTYTTDINLLDKVDFVIEAVSELPEAKQEAYKKLSLVLPKDAILATNTSMLLPKDFVDFVPNPKQYCALHFANFIWKFNFAEVMAHKETSKDTLEKVYKYAIDIGMVPIPVEKENNGYILNSWFFPLCHSGLTLVTNGVGSPENVDRSFMLFNKPVTMGPLGMVDMVGMNTAYNILTYWGNVFKDQQMLKNAAYIKEHYIDKGKLGVLSGEGFYKYPKPAFEAKDFINIPNYNSIDELVKRTLLN